MTQSPSGRRVLVTRAAHQAGKLSDALRALGLEPVEVPVLEIRPPESYAPLDAALRQLVSPAPDATNENKQSAVILSQSAAADESNRQITISLSGDSSDKRSDVILSDQTLNEVKGKGVEGPAVAFPQANPAENQECHIHSAFSAEWMGDHKSQSTAQIYDWLIVTSANTVSALNNRAAALGLTLANYIGQAAAVGEATATAAREAGLTVSLIPESYVAESLVASLKDHVTGKRILIARAAIARDFIPDALRAAGAEVTVVDAYRNVIPESAAAQLRAALKQGVAAATFTSSSSVSHLAAVAKRAGVAFPFAGVPAISIGPITTQTLREHNCPPAAEATVSDIPGLAAAVASVLR